MISTTLTILLATAAVGLAGLLIAGVAYAATAQQSPSVTKRIISVSAGVVLGWVLLVFALTTAGVFAANYDKAQPSSWGSQSPSSSGWVCSLAPRQCAVCWSAFPHTG
jgi:hypothetical protein